MTNQGRPAPLKMSDIAALAGVSEATVSRALGGSKLISEATRARIREIAAAHDYRIDQQARNLRLQRTGTISVVFPLLHEVDQGISDPFFLELLGRLADELSDRRYDLLLHKIAPGEPRGVRELLRERRTDGMVLVGQSTQHGVINELAASYQPLVVWGAPIEGSSYTTVGSDNRGGGRLAVEHLLRLGRRRIAFFGDRRLSEVAARHAGYVDALAAHGLAPAPALDCRVPFGRALGEAAMAAFLDSGVPFDAVFAASDLVAIAAIGMLARRGLAVPRDVAVVGFDDIMLAGAFTPPLTTVRQDIAAGARALVDTLFARMAGQAVGSQLLPVRLVVRESCGAAGPNQSR